MDERKQKQIFAEWIRQHKGIVFKIIRAYAFNPSDQDDLFQEISLQLWQSIPEFRGEAKSSTWIYRVALYAATVWVRREKKRPPTQPLADMEHVLTAATQSHDDRSDWLYEQIGQLEPIDRSVCLLLLDGFSYKEMADLLGVSESNVGVKVHRIKQYLIQKSKEIVHHEL
ncbi:MAG TPA: sigma-70 family RNA polymerase sigma factor [Anaerolineales bacterium]|nr:sigma-70 family RNA polymerase sigma factor [Anaerolineales bacterium]